MVKNGHLFLALLILAVLIGGVRRSAAADGPKLTAAEQQKLNKLIEGLNSDDLRALYLTMSGLRAMGPKAVAANDQLVEMLRVRRYSQMQRIHCKKDPLPFPNFSMGSPHTIRAGR